MDNSLTHTMHEVIAIMDKRADTILNSQFGISYSWFLILVVLMRQGSLNQHQLALSIGHSDPAISRLIPKLIDAGYLTTTISPKHKRKNIVKLTKKGEKLAKSSSELLESMFSRLLEESKIDLSKYSELTIQIRDTLRNR